MSDPVSVISAGLSVVGTVSAVKGAGDAADAQAAAFQQQAAQAQLQKEASAFQTKQDIVDLKRESYKILGAMRANYAASGVTVDGSPMDVLEASANLAALDIERRRTLGGFQERGFVLQGQSASAQAADARTAGMFNTASAFLSGSQDLLNLVPENFLGGPTSSGTYNKTYLSHLGSP